ncbi:MAG: FAD-dependent oxidoreductase [Terriglobia bacterium]
MTERDGWSFMAGAMTEKRCVIIGAGFAGATTAFHLTQMGMTHVKVIEQEAIPGSHASGKNAAMIRQVVSGESVSAMARGGAAFLRQLPDSWPVETPFQQIGSFLLTNDEGAIRLQADGRRSRESGVKAEWWPLEQIVRQVPVLEGSPCLGGIWCPTDGVIDIHGLIRGYLKSAEAGGAEVRFSEKLNRIITRNQRVVAVETNVGEFEVDIVVNAAGAWAGAIAALAGATAIPMIPYRRHLYVTEALDWVSPAWPIIWDLAHELYFRPESGGLLLSPCDESPESPGLPAQDPSVLEMLAEKTLRCFPKLAELRIRNSWCGLRTFAPDRHFVIGWDPNLDGFFWVAGLGGHGVTVSYSAGVLAASLILQSREHVLRNEFSPARFVTK